MKKTKRFELVLSELDYKIIKKKAEILDISLAEYLRQAGTNKYVKGFKMSELNDINIKGQITLDELLNS